MAERVQIILEDETRMTDPSILVEAIEVLEKLRKLGNHAIVFETDDTYTRIEVQTEKKKAFWKRWFSK